MLTPPVLLRLVIVGTAILVAACGLAPVAKTGGDEAGANLDGRGLYAANCARCHGGDLKGTTLGPPFLHAVYARGHHGDAAFAIAVKNGVRAHHWNFGPMPPVDGLTDEQVKLITAFVRSEQQKVGIR